MSSSRKHRLGMTVSEQFACVEADFCRLVRNELASLACREGAGSFASLFTALTSFYLVPEPVLIDGPWWVALVRVTMVKVALTFYSEKTPTQLQSGKGISTVGVSPRLRF
ncbi:hypothetical protein BDN67DRAFT_975992 [Paxillus ammoniavirescens]|nr:hypothetical protein BDN67DRAFT_975992 [Paxillus ammoniavirescens]